MAKFCGGGIHEVMKCVKCVCVCVGGGGELFKIQGGVDFLQSSHSALVLWKVTLTGRMLQ